MSKRASRRAKAKLNARRRAYDGLRAPGQLRYGDASKVDRKRPGSLNPRKR